MEKVILFTLFMIIILGCSPNEKSFTDPPTIEGYIMSVREKEILVVNGISKEQATDLSWVELTNASDKKYDAYTVERSSWFEDFSEYHVGQKVKVWGEEGADESYPARIKSAKIKLVE